MIAKLATIVAVAFGPVLTSNDSTVGKPTCCMKRAYYSAVAVPQTAVGDSVVAKPTCCMKRAYCCKIKRPCCR